MTTTPKQWHKAEINRQELLSDVAQYIRRYVACSDDQLTVLALWVLSGYFPQTGVFTSAPYLNIYSAEPQSGKTTCLKMLGLLAREGWYTSGTSARVLFTKLRCFRGTLLLDDRHVSFSSSERQALVAFLNGGAAENGSYGYLHSEEPFGVSDHSGFAAKAFAGQGPLPPSLASRCIPINLKRRKPSEPVECFRYHLDFEPVESLFARLNEWSERDREHLRPLAHQPPADMPPGLTPHQQQCARPLVHIADLIGDPWPAKIRTALARIFEADAQDDAGTRQLLSDIRDCFAAKENPEFMPSRDLLTHLHGLEERTWKHWKGRAMTPHALAAELRPLRIKSYLDWNSADPARGYRYQDFLEPWDRSLSAACLPVAVSNQLGSLDLTLQSVRNLASVREIASNGAGPNTLTL